MTSSKNDVVPDRSTEANSACVDGHRRRNAGDTQGGATSIPALGSPDDDGLPGERNRIVRDEEGDGTGQLVVIIGRDYLAVVSCKIALTRTRSVDHLRPIASTMATTPARATVRSIAPLTRWRPKAITSSRWPPPPSARTDASLRAAANSSSNPNCELGRSVVVTTV